MKTVVKQNLESVKIVVEEGQKMQFVLIANGGDAQSNPNEISKLDFELNGPGSELSFIGFVIGRESQFYGFETVSNHLNTHSKAKFSIGAVMFDRSKVDYKGYIVVPKNAQYTDAFLNSRVMLAGEESRAKTIPCLEIEADDVKAGHAAAIGKVDAEEMFYLQSRGINKKDAEEMLVMSFFESQLGLIEDLETRDHVRDIVIKSLSITK